MAYTFHNRFGAQLKYRVPINQLTEHEIETMTKIDMWVFQFQCVLYNPKSKCAMYIWNSQPAKQTH